MSILSRQVGKNLLYKSRYGEWKVYVVLDIYATSSRYVIRLLDHFDGSPVCTATVNIPDILMADDEVLIKNYSENEGVLAFLQENGIVGPVLEDISTGHVTVQRCKLLIT